MVARFCRVTCGSQLDCSESNSWYMQMLRSGYISQYIHMYIDGCAQVTTSVGA